MAEPFETRELVAALDDDGQGTMFSINDLPNDVLVSIFVAVEDPCWVRHTVPCVCKTWAELYRSQDASPLHEELEVDFRKEVESAAASEAGSPRGIITAARAAAQRGALRRPVIHASKVISWAERRAGSVRRLHLKEGCIVSREPFTSEDVGRLVAATASSLTELWICCGLYKQYEPLWESLRDSFVPAARLRSLVVKRIYVDVSESDVEPLGQLSGTLEELVLDTYFDDPEAFEGIEVGLPRFPESLCALTELRRLELVGHHRIKAIPAKISSLKKLKELTLDCRLSSLPKELGELSGLTKLDLATNNNLGKAPEEEAFPAELGNMKSLRELSLSSCGLRTVPAFVGELESLEVLDLTENDVQIYTSLDFLVEGCPRLRKVRVSKEPHSACWTRESLAHLDAFKAKLLAVSPNAEVLD